MHYSQAVYYGVHGSATVRRSKIFSKKKLVGEKKKTSFWNEIGNGGGISRRLRYPRPPFHFKYTTKISTHLSTKRFNEIWTFREEMLYRTTSEVGTQQQAVISCVGYSTELPYTYCIKLTGISGRVFNNNKEQQPLEGYCYRFRCSKQHYRQHHNDQHFRSHCCNQLWDIPYIVLL